MIYIFGCAVRAVAAIYCVSVCFFFTIRVSIGVFVVCAHFSFSSVSVLLPSCVWFERNLPRVNLKIRKRFYSFRYRGVIKSICFARYFFCIIFFLFAHIYFCADFFVCFGGKFAGGEVARHQQRHRRGIGIYANKHDAIYKNWCGITLIHFYRTIDERNKTNAGMLSIPCCFCTKIMII